MTTDTLLETIEKQLLEEARSGRKYEAFHLLPLVWGISECVDRERVARTAFDKAHDGLRDVVKDLERLWWHSPNSAIQPLHSIYSIIGDMEAHKLARSSSLPQGTPIDDRQPAPTADEGEAKGDPAAQGDDEERSSDRLRQYCPLIGEGLRRFLQLCEAHKAIGELDPLLRSDIRRRPGPVSEVLGQLVDAIEQLMVGELSLTKDEQ